MTRSATNRPHTSETKQPLNGIAMDDPTISGLTSPLHTLDASTSLQRKTPNHLQPPHPSSSVSSNSSLIPRQTPLPRKLMLHHRLRIPVLLRNTRSRRVLVRIVYRLAFHLSQLLDPLSYELALLIKLLRLQPRIEDPEIRLRIHTRRRREAPAAIIGCKVAIDEVRDEVLFAEAPIEEKVLCEERCGDHAVAVVHVACVVEGAHRGVDDGVARATFLPGGEVGVVVFPFDVGVFEFEGFVHTSEHVSRKSFMQWIAWSGTYQT